MKRLVLLFCFLFICCAAYAQQVSADIKSLLSGEGKVLFGNEPNSIVVIDYPENLERVTEYLETVDVPPRQVLIEARVVEVKLQKEHSLGVNWSIFANNGGFEMGQFKVGSTAAGALEQAIPYKNTYYPPTGSSGSESPFTINIFDENINIILKTLANSLDTNILSAPRVTTVNNRQAEIKIIQSYPWAEPEATTSDSGATTISWTVHFEEIGIILRVTPTITEDGRIIMELNPEVSEKTSDLPLTASGLTYNVPIIDKRKASTKVVIGNGQTLIIGGLIKDKSTKGLTKVPFFGDVPLLGYLFKSKKDVNDKTELLIFVSPTVVTPKVYTDMDNSYRYGIGREFLKAQERNIKVRELLELQETEQKEKILSKLNALAVRQEELVSERTKLETQVKKEEAALKELEDTKKAITAEGKNLPESEKAK